MNLTIAQVIYHRFNSLITLIIRDCASSIEFIQLVKKLGIIRIWRKRIKLCPFKIAFLCSTSLFSFSGTSSATSQLTMAINVSVLETDQVVIRFAKINNPSIVPLYYTIGIGIFPLYLLQNLYLSWIVNCSPLLLRRTRLPEYIHTDSYRK
jgi:hypothetical protein